LTDVLNDKRGKTHETAREKKPETDTEGVIAVFHDMLEN
jgi:hypothetical protein